MVNTSSHSIPKIGLKNFIKRSAIIGGPMATIVGTIADIATPLLAFSNYLMLISFVAMLFVGFYWFKKKRPQLIEALSDGRISESEYISVVSANRWYISFSFITIFFLISSSFAVLGLLPQNSKRGFLANHMDIVVEVQDNLFKIEEKIDAVKSDTETILAELKNLSQNFDQLKQNATLIENPTSATDFYVNAKLYQLKGNTQLAAHSYKKFIDFKLDYLDPHLSYIELLKITQSDAQAKKTYQAILQSQPTPVVMLAYSLFLEKESKIASLDKLARDYPKFTPVYWQLADAYSQESLGLQSLEEKKLQAQHLKTLVDDQGREAFLEYFVDKSMGVKIFDEAETKLRALKVDPSLGVNEPVSYSMSFHNAGATIMLTVAEPVRELKYRLPQDKEFQSTGLLDWLDPTTGKKAVNPSIAVNELTGKFTLEVKYTDLKAVEHGPIKLTVDPVHKVVEETKRILRQTQPWVSFINNGSAVRAYFTGLMTRRNAIEQISYSIDSGSLAQKFPLKPYKRLTPSPIDPQQPIFIDLPKKSKKMFLKLKYRDGSYSEVVELNIPDAVSH